VQQDRDTLICEFEAARNVFVTEVACTLEETTHIINDLSTLLAARKVEREHRAFAKTRSTRGYRAPHCKVESGNATEVEGSFEWNRSKRTGLGTKDSLYEEYARSF